jgi:hypothetical protein
MVEGWWVNWVTASYTGTTTTYYPDQTTAAYPLTTGGNVGNNNLWYNFTTTGTTMMPQQANVWTTWINGVEQYAYGYQANALPPAAPLVLTAEEQAARAATLKRNQIIAANRRRSVQLRRKLADKRAEQLLLEHLNEEQAAEWTKDRAFHIETADGRRKYRIAYGLQHNVRVVKCEEPLTAQRGVALREGHRLCAHVYHPDGPIPDADNVLAQKLLLEADEERFIAMAYAS